MRNSHRSHWLALGLISMTLLGFGCRDSDPAAPPGSSIILSASPADLPGVGGVSLIQAVILDSNGIPQRKVNVFFSTNSGTLDSGGVGVQTNDDGIAQDRLVTFNSANVNAQSGDATAQVTVTVGGVEPVGMVTLTCSPPSGSAPLRTTCTVQVTSTRGNALFDQIVDTIISDGSAVRSPAATLFP